MKPLLLIEDDEELGRTLSSQLKDQDYEVIWCQSVQEFLAQKNNSFAAAVVDVNLPDGSGFDVLRQLSIPAILMTALNTPENRLQGLELGAVDFIPKPFLFKELHIKLERLLAQQNSKVQLPGGIQIDLLERTIESPQGTNFLNDRELKILKCLMSKAPSVVSRDEILDTLGVQLDASSHRSIDNVIVKLRQQMNDEDHLLIKSVRGVGYQWLGGKSES